MKVGLIGHRGAGKTTVFNMLTGLQAQVGAYGGKEEVHLGVIKVPDVRVDKLSQIFKPKKTTYAEIGFTDFPASQSEADLKGNNSLVTQMRDVDAMALGLRNFNGADPSGLNDLLTEMILADLTVIENPAASKKGESTASGRRASRTLRGGSGKREEPEKPRVQHGRGKYSFRLWFSQSQAGPGSFQSGRRQSRAAAAGGLPG
jgi:ribosome-binding ATPase YchF (GTP1/OBG family)